MNRLKQAWLALCGKLEPEEVRVLDILGPASVVNAYRVDVSSPIGIIRRLYFLTCEQAHGAWSGCEVRKVEVIKADGRYFSGRYGLDEIVVQPKAKIKAASA